MTVETTSAPTVERVRHELKRRDLEVLSVERLTPAMVRVTLGGESLADFTSLAPDDHIKLFVPDASGMMAMRDYTPRAYDNEAQTLVVDFAVHDAGPATAWALAVKPGDSLQIGGPRGSAVVTGDIRRFILIGDETALPAIGRRIEETAAGVAIDAYIAVPGAADEQSFKTDATLTTTWIHRPEHASDDPAPFLEAIGDVACGEGTYVWIAAEARVAKAIRTHFLEELGHPLTWMKASGYWVKGQADSSEKSIGEAPPKMA
ncbi:siderophore-interacting protein [Cohaesibacter haloalkalitolerans]|uniref:siderophore-interacting protein n=1 Tax=Cohaesibacter haloalkalitolerans TaxID=1162980 RepID=UPI000E64750F|nr:siderophore-interacting protein [Cohaesibacter haloalkalitolerans]